MPGLIIGLYKTAFSHPDYTVGSGMSPDLPYGSRAVTAGQESKVRPLITHHLRR
jgi:hypothetical protein